MARKRRSKLIPQFHCVPWNCKLAPDACAKRFREAQLERKPGVSRTAIHCEGCSVGAGHAKRRRPEAWADGRPVVRSTRETFAVPVSALTRKVSLMPEPNAPWREADVFASAEGDR